MQGGSITILTAEDKAASMKLIFKSWYQCVQRNNFDCFDTMNEYDKELGKAVSENVLGVSDNHKTHLKNIFHQTVMTVIC
jgi:hypothetical protein